MPDPEFADNVAQTRFELRIDGRVAGFTDYRKDGDALCIVHTEVAPGNEGGGLGSKLAKAALDTLRQRGQHVVPECDFIAGYIQRHPQYADLVAQS